MPRPRKPSHLKHLSGTARPDRAAPPTPTLPPLESTPTAPAWLTNQFAAAEWNRLVPILRTNNLLHAGNIGVVAQLCAVHGVLVQTWSSGAMPTAALVSAYRRLCGDVGLSGLNIIEQPQRPNRFSRFNKK